MKHTMFFLLWSAVLAFLSMIVGVLALIGYSNAEVIFWTRSAIESKGGKIAWIVISTTCLMVFLGLAAREYRKK